MVTFPHPFVVSPSNHERSHFDGPVLSEISPFDRANGVDGLRANGDAREIRQRNYGPKH
jgi:hypothetical protein